MDPWPLRGSNIQEDIGIKKRVGLTPLSTLCIFITLLVYTKSEIDFFSYFCEGSFSYGNCVYILYTKIEQDVYNWCIQNVSNMNTIFRQTFVYIFYTKLKELSQLKFVYKMCTEVCRNVAYILYTDILYTFCIYQFWSTKSVLHKNYAYNLYTKFIQSVYTNNCMQNGSHISTYFDPFVVHFLAN